MQSMIAHPICNDPVFIIGSPRSGTSILAWSLHQHKDLWTSLESDLLFNLYGDNHAENAFREATKRPEGSWLAEQNVSMDEYVACLGYGVNALYTSRSQGKRWVDQTPLNTVLLPMLASMFPGARFLHILRDPRRVVHSMMNFNSMLGSDLKSALVRTDFLPKWSTDFREGCCTWRLFVERALDFQEQQAKRCFTITNEELAADSSAGFARIFAFLQIPNLPHSAEYFRTNRINSSFTKGPDVAPGPRKSRPWERWSDGQKSIFMSELGPTLRKYKIVPEDELSNYLTQCDDGARPEPRAYQGNACER